MAFEILDHFSQFYTLSNVIYCAIGVLIGTLIGVIPGIGPSTALALLLPVTFYIPAPQSIIMMIGIYYGSQYGGSTTAILMKVAGEVTSIPTIIEGNLLAKKGRAGPALTIAATSSFFAGIVTTFIIYFFVIHFSEFSLKLGPSEYVGLGIIGLIGSLFLSNDKNYFVNVGLLCIGSLIGFIGLDPIIGNQRFTFNILKLYDGIGIIIVSIGIFGLSEVFRSNSFRKNEEIVEKIYTMYPNKDEIKRSVYPTIRGTFAGLFLGLFPGGTLLSSFVSYFFEKKFSKYKNEFGSGAIEGVAGPESANNASSQSSLIPTLSLGIPINASTAMILGALTIYGFVPGPKFTSHSNELFLVLISSMLLGNLFLLFLNIPLVSIWIKVLFLSKKYFNFLILFACLLGVFNIGQSYFEIFLIVIFGLFGFFIMNNNLDCVPLIMGFLLTPMIEEQFRRAMMMSKGNLDIFWNSEINIFLIIGLSIVSLSIKIYKKYK